MRLIFWISALAMTILAQSAVAAPTCGHAAGMREAFNHGLLPTLVSAKVIELPLESDVLHNALNIELAPPSNVLGPSDNTITAKSLRSGLVEFTFRLSDTFTLGTVTLDGRPITITRLDPTTCRANFDRPYALNEQFTLYIPYSGPAVSSFFGSIEFGTRASGAPYCFTLSEPWYAYTWWPNKDDNTDKATFDINITVPNTQKAVSNGVLQGTDVVAGSKLRFRWHTGYPMAPYLAFIATTNFNTWSTTYNYAGGSMPVQFWIWPESDTTANRNAWNNCVSMMTTFAPIYGIYPFKDEKYGMYQFTFSGGMEHQTCTGMGGFWESVTAHELAHQWWGDMITCATWHDIWLNEGFATYSEALWSERKSGGSFSAYKTSMANRRPSQTSGTVYCYDITDPNRIFSGTYTYNKGAWVLHMLRKIVGDSTFFNILADYRAAHEFKTATTDDFIASCERVYGKDLNWFFDKYVYGGGAPVYQWNWQSVTSNGKNYALVYVKQTQSTTYGTFAMPIDIRPTVGGIKQQKQVFSDALVENFVIPLTGPATACTFDEDVWVLNGGVTTTPFVAGGPTIVEVSPSPNAKVTTLNEIKVTFHTGVNASATDFKLQLDDARKTLIPFGFSYSATTNTVTLNVAKRLVAGSYTLTVKDSLRATASNLQLDGELGATATLPSGNGQPAGSAVIRFKVSGP